MGAAFGGAGHVSFLSPGHFGASDRGFLTLLGDPEMDQPLMAEIYTAPRDLAVDAIQIEAEVTESLCGRSMTGQKFALSVAGGVSIQPVVISMPPCDAVGDFVVMTLASAPGRLQTVEAAE
jgi:hypothetical protein